MNAYELKDKLNEIIPFSISEKLIEKGYYDNSGIICDGEGDKILFTLDLTFNAVNKAKELGCGLIVTHHPAIFSPIKSVEGALKEAIKNGIGVISAHLNADFATFGVDYYLAKALGEKDGEILEKYDFGGYGRLFEINISLEEFLLKVKQELKAKNIFVFGQNKQIKKVATFCGAGLDEKSLALAKGADLVLSSDIKHHVILNAVSEGKIVVQLSHYATENYGFKQIYKNFSKTVKEQVFYYEEDVLL